MIISEVFDENVEVKNDGTIISDDFGISKLTISEGIKEDNNWVVGIGDKYLCFTHSDYTKIPVNYAVSTSKLKVEREIIGIDNCIFEIEKEIEEYADSLK